MNANLTWSEIFVDELARSGLRHVCIAPGSRNTPLTLAFAAHPTIKVHSLLDERCAGFFALGLALATGAPVAVLCTSGSAIANFFPAVVEAHMSQVPLLVLTADRPHELRHSGANQTIDQVKLFGDYAQWSVDMALPESAPGELAQRNLRTTAARALATANGLRPGVVHLNFPFRKPLEPTPPEAAEHAPGFAQSGEPHTYFSRGRIEPGDDDLAALAALIEAHPRGAIVCGPNCPDGLASPLLALAHAAAYPVFADPLSGVRADDAAVIGSYDLLLGAAGLSLQPDLILRFGAMPTSAALCDALAASGAAQRIHVAESGAWADDDHRTGWFLQANEAVLCRGLSRALAGRERAESDWLRGWHRVDAAARVALQQALQAQWFDGAAVQATLDALPEGARAFVGNSLAVRHADEFAPNTSRVKVFGSRGASGIDGNVSTVLGIAAADTTRRTVGTVGDVTLHHDMNGLLAINRLGLRNAQIVVLNNNGGAIFLRLPIAKLDPPFTELWITPHGIDFAGAAQTYGLSFARAASRAELEQQLAAGTQLIEVRTDAHADMAARQAVRAAVRAAMETVVTG
jgi:2-succinyl-5-enolpyruvyl-6-hydroxy-3-cyclohexene-1-carboxylate synthase